MTNLGIKLLVGANRRGNGNGPGGRSPKGILAAPV
jgi:hypothetical protein